MKKNNGFDSDLDNEFNKVPRGYTVKFKKNFSERFNEKLSSLQLEEDDLFEEK